MLLSPLLVVCIRLYAIILDPFFEGNMFWCCCFFWAEKVRIPFTAGSILPWRNITNFPVQ